MQAEKPANQPSYLSLFLAYGNMSSAPLYSHQQGEVRRYRLFSFGYTVPLKQNIINAALQTVEGEIIQMSDTTKWSSAVLKFTNYDLWCLSDRVTVQVLPWALAWQNLQSGERQPQ